MPDAAISALFDGAQPLQRKTCPECGILVFGRTMHKQFCQDCSAERKRISRVKAADRQRRKKGIPKVKGEAFFCAECGCEFIATSKSRAKYCVECRDVVMLRNANESSRRRTSDPERRDRFNAWFRARGRVDPKVALSRMMRNLMYRELGRKSDRESSWFEVVGYTAQELKVHLERQFLPGMTWENRGTHGWHVDHIVPIASFNYDSHDHPDFRACWALTNLRPMWGVDNVKKSDKRVYLI